MIKLKDLLNEQNYKVNMLKWLQDNKSDFLANLKIMGFNERGFALNQLPIPNSDKSLGGASLPQYILNKMAFNTITGAPTKLMQKNNALASSVSKTPVVITSAGKVKLNLPAGIKKGRNFPVDPMAGQMNVEQLCSNANRANIANYRVGGNQVINIFASQDGQYNEATVGKSSNLHLYSTKEVASRTTPGTPEKRKPGVNIPPINVGNEFASDSDQLNNPAEVKARVQQAINIAAKGGISIPNMGVFMIAAGTDQQGDDEYNKKLAGRRANAVRNILLGLKVDPNQIQINLDGVEKGDPPPGPGDDVEAWREKNKDYRFVTLSFPGLTTPDKVTPAKPAVTRDRPERVQINHMEVFIKK
jgi:outer membrane protein OmpA-like peptidoglycan-associated protein